VEPDAPAATRALCAADVVILEIGEDARGMFTPVHPSV
jgi:hypothetical protein